jgi:hypothetical protein
LDKEIAWKQKPPLDDFPVMTPRGPFHFRTKDNKSLPQQASFRDTKGVALDLNNYPEIRGFSHLRKPFTTVSITGSVFALFLA